MHHEIFPYFFNLNIQRILGKSSIVANTLSQFHVEANNPSAVKTNPDFANKVT